MKIFCLLSAIFLTFTQYIMLQNDKNIEYQLINGSKIYYHESGAGNSTIVLVSGLTLGLETWKSFQEQLSRYARVISYDRTGLGNSDYKPNQKTIDSMVNELDILINKLDVNTPIILVGHSVGGHIIKKYTELFPEKIASVFLIDSYHELFYKELKNSITEEMWDDYVNSFVNMKSKVSSGVSEELDFYLELLTSNEKYPIPTDIPVYMFTSIKEVEVEEKFVEFNKIAYKVHLKLNNQLKKNIKTLTT